LHPLESAAFSRRTPFSDIHCPELIAAKWSLVLVARHQLQVVPMVATTPRGLTITPVGGLMTGAKTSSKLATAYMENVCSTPEELAKWMVEERKRWAPVIKHAGLITN
jgi:hypothetical protein